jgi:hypothetical protein
MHTYGILESRAHQLMSPGSLMSDEEEEVEEEHWHSKCKDGVSNSARKSYLYQTKNKK